MAQAVTFSPAFAYSKPTISVFGGSLNQKVAASASSSSSSTIPKSGRQYKTLGLVVCKWERDSKKPLPLQVRCPPRAASSSDSTEDLSRMAQNYGSVSLQIPVFNGENYEYWAIKMKTLMISQDLWDIVKRDFQASTTNEDELKRLRKEDAKALFIIQSGLDLTVFPKIVMHQTSKAAWDALEIAYKGSLKVRGVKLQAFRKDFESLQMLDSENIDQYISRFQQVQNGLESCGETLEERRVVEKILRSVTRRYDPLVVAIEEARDLDKMTMVELVGSLKTYEQRIANREDTPANAFHAQFQRSSNQHQNQRSSSGSSFRERGRSRGRSGGRGRVRSNQSNDILTPELKATLDKFVTSNKVVLFMKGTKDFPQCGFSNTVVQILKSLNVSFQAFDILGNELLRQGLKEYSNWPTFPQLYIDGEFFGGCDITLEAYKTGELQELLEKAMCS